MKIRKLLPIIAILILSFGTYISLSYAQDGTEFPDVPDVPEYVNGQKSEPIYPTIPVIVDGVWISPETFAKHYSMADLTFIYSKKTQDFLYAFSTEEGLQKFIEEEKKIDIEQPEGARASSWLFSNTNYGGSSNSTSTCNAKAYLWGFNDVASSLTSSPSCSYFKIFEHVMWGGRSVWTPGGGSVPNLGGFDNMTSSTSHQP